jgi:hypothetical protein
MTSEKGEDAWWVLRFEIEIRSILIIVRLIIRAKAKA